MVSEAGDRGHNNADIYTHTSPLVHSAYMDIASTVPGYLCRGFSECITVSDKYGWSAVN